MIAPAQIAGALTIGDFKKMVAPGFAPPPREDPEVWLPGHVRFPSGSEEPLFDFDKAPYCRGVVQRFWNDGKRRKANLCWGVRLGKTSLVLSLLAWQALNDPCPMALLFPDNDLLNSGVDDHVWPMFEATPIIRRQLPPRHQWNKRVIRFRDCRIRLASAGKKSSVSGYPARVIGKIEHEKCGTRKSSEADASARMDSRAAGYPIGVKIIEEGSPADRETSRVHVMIEDPDVMKLYFHVPCPHCGKFQRLEWEQVEWDKHPETGKSTAAIAKKTARYKCCHCGDHIRNDQRKEMICRGVWAAEGETVDKRGRVRGKAIAEDAEDMVFILSSLYSLRLRSWGTMAAEFVKASRAADQGKTGALQKFWTEKLARVWNPYHRKTQPHKVAARLRADDHTTSGVCPDWTSFLTLTSDVGKVGEEMFFYWMVTAWGAPDKRPRGAVCDWQIAEGKPSFLDWWKEKEYPIAGGGDVRLWGQPAAVDSGDFTEEIYRFVNPIRGAWPLKGDSPRRKAKADVDTYSLGFARAGFSPSEVRRKQKAGHPDLFQPSSEVTQGWRVALTEGRLTIVDPWFVSVPGDICGERWENYRDFFEELTADQFIDGKWQGDQNEFGDTLRYARALAEWFVHNHHAGQWARVKPIGKNGKSAGGAPASSIRRGGRKGGGGSFVNRGWKR